MKTKTARGGVKLSPRTLTGTTYLDLYWPALRCSFERKRLCTLHKAWLTWSTLAEHTSICRVVLTGVPLPLNWPTDTKRPQTLAYCPFTCGNRGVEPRAPSANVANRVSLEEQILFRGLGTRYHFSRTLSGEHPTLRFGRVCRTRRAVQSCAVHPRSRAGVRF